MQNNLALQCKEMNGIRAVTVFFAIAVAVATPASRGRAAFPDAAVTRRVSVFNSSTQGSPYRGCVTALPRCAQSYERVVQTQTHSRGLDTISTASLHHWHTSLLLYHASLTVLHVWSQHRNASFSSLAPNYTL